MNVNEWGQWTEADGGALLVPTEARWRALVSECADAAIDGSGLSLMDEAAAVFALFWRYGSFASALCTGEYFSQFQKNKALSRINDDEMCRIQMEFSSGLAYYLDLRVSDRNRARSLAAKAIQDLEMPWRISLFHEYGSSDGRGREIALEDVLRSKNWREQAIQAAVENGGDANTYNKMYHERQLGSHRQLANHLVNAYYRNNSPLESLHAGSQNTATRILGYKRFHSEEVERLAQAFCGVFAQKLAIADSLGVPWLMEECGIDVFNDVRNRWSETDEVSSIQYDGKL